MLPNFLNRTFPARRFETSIPPASFSKVENPTNVRLIDYTHSPRRLSAARKAGIRYEAKWNSFAKQFFEARHYWTFEHRLFAYNDTSGQRCCRPDGVLIPAGGEWFAIFEVKVGHILDSYWQLRHCYQPVLSAWPHLEGRRPVVLEVCRRYDPFVVYPCASKVLGLIDLEDYLNAPQPPEEVGVLIWKGK